MVVLLRCRCLNVTLHLQNLPSEETASEFDWLRTSLQCDSQFGRGELGVAGIKVEVEKLLTIKQVTKDWKPWNCVCCINCGLNLYAFDVSKPNVLAVNLNLLKSQDEIERLAKSNAYSPTFRVVLEDEDAISNNPLESPDVFDAQLWNKLQKQVEETVKREENAHQQMIDEFIKEQQRLLMERQSKAYRDRKIIWHKICKYVPQKPEAPTAASSTTPPTNTPTPTAAAQVRPQHDKAIIPPSSFSSTSAKPMGRDRTSGGSPFAGSPSNSSQSLSTPSKLSTTPTTSMSVSPKRPTITVASPIPSSNIPPPALHSPTVAATIAPIIPTINTTQPTTALSSTFTASNISERDRVGNNAANTSSGNISRSFVLKPLFGDRNTPGVSSSNNTMGMKKEGRGLLSATKERTVEPLAVAAAAAAVVAAPIFAFEGDGEVADMAASDFEGNKVTDMAFEMPELMDDFDSSSSRREAAGNESTRQMLSILSSSVPVSIPLPPGKRGTTAFSLITDDEEDGAAKDRYSHIYKRPHEIVEEEAEVNEMSKSFAVPLSMTRRIKSFI